MDWMEQELRSALARKDPPPGFAEGVARALTGPAQAPAAKPKGRILSWPARATRRWLAAAAAVVLMAGGAAGYRWHEGLVAKRQVMQAFAIAGGQLNHLQARIKQVSQ